MRLKINDVVVFDDGSIGVVSFVYPFPMSKYGIQYYDVDRIMIFSMYFPEIVMEKIGHL